MFNLKDGDGVKIEFVEENGVMYGTIAEGAEGIIIKINNGPTITLQKTNSTLCIPPEEWLKEQFKDGYCECCGGDEADHNAVPFIGNWFARCKHELSETLTDYECEVEMKMRRDRKERGLSLVQEGRQ